MTQIQKNAKVRVVIVGGGFAGLSAARALASTPADITLIDKSNHHLFQPLLYQVATAGLSPADIAAPIRSILSHQKNAEVLLGEVKGVDVAGKTVLLDDRKVGFDYLVLATGARHSYFGKPEWEEDAPGLKSVNDATRIRTRILMAFERAESETHPEKKKQLLTFTIVGAGPTGVEIAGAIAELAHVTIAKDFRHIDPKLTRILLIEASPRILASFPEKLAKKARERLEKFGVEIMTGARVEQVDSEGVVVGGKRVLAGNVIWAAGVVASPAGKWLGCEVDRNGRVMVSPFLTVLGNENIFVIGDTSTLSMPETGGKPLPGLAPVAMQEGRYVARSIATRVKGGKLEKFRYTDKGNLATVGRAFAIAEFKGLKLSGFFAWITWLLVHIYYLIGFKNRLVVLLEWTWAYLTFQRGARLITGDGEGHIPHVDKDVTHLAR